MKKLLIGTVVTVSLIVLYAGTGLCEGRSVLGGYDVAKIAADTLSVLEDSKTLADAEYADLSKLVVPEPADPLAWDTSYNELYAKFGALLERKGIATQADIDRMNATAAEAGGAKVAGQNPVVLAASFLDLLARKGIITLPQAQAILDSARQ